MPITETRLIYTKGVFKISDAFRDCRRILIVTDLLRFPAEPQYFNEKSNPPHYFLGYVTLWMKDYVFSKFPLEFENQIVFEYQNPGLQLANISLGIGNNISNWIQALGAAMTPPASVVFLPQPDITFESCPFSQLKFQLTFGTRIQVTCVGYETEFFEGQKTQPASSDPQDDTPKYPKDRPRIEDPARNLPYDDENPGDTSLASSDDPDASLTDNGTWLIRFFYTGLFVSTDNRYIESGSFSAVGFVTLGNVVYSNPGNSPPGSFRTARIATMDSAGGARVITLVDNSVGGATVSEISAVKI